MALALGLWASEAHAGKASIVIQYDTGKVLHAVDPDTRLYPASLTKMMTLYLAFEALRRGHLRLDDKLRVSRHAAGMPPSKLGLEEGGAIMVKDAILALITKSANDAAVVMAEALGGTEHQFAQWMTRKAHALGMNRTSFHNASGLPNSLQLSTARDMATLARALIRDFPEYYRLFATGEFNFRGRKHKNHNRLLKSYRGADGIKTGYIRASGFNLATSAVRSGSRLIAVVLGRKSPRSRNGHAARILDRAFARMSPNDFGRLPGPPPRKPTAGLTVSLNETDAPLGTVLQRIGEQAGFNVYITPRNVPKNDRYLKAYSAANVRRAEVGGNTVPGLLGIAAQTYRANVRADGERTDSLADSMRDAVWRKNTSAKLKTLLSFRRMPCVNGADADVRSPSVNLGSGC